MIIDFDITRLISLMQLFLHALRSHLLRRVSSKMAGLLNSSGPPLKRQASPIAAGLLYSGGFSYSGGPPLQRRASSIAAGLLCNDGPPMQRWPSLQQLDSFALTSLFVMTGLHRNDESIPQWRASACILCTKRPLCSSEVLKATTQHFTSSSESTLIDLLLILQYVVRCYTPFSCPGN